LYFAIHLYQKIIIMYYHTDGLLFIFFGLFNCYIVVSINIYCKSGVELPSLF